MNTVAKTITGMAAIVFLAAGPAQSSEPDKDAIRLVLMRTWDKPDARLVVDPIVAAGNFAIAGWSQGDMGGRALLRKKNDVWNVMLCAGDDLRKQQVLTKIGVPENVSAHLERSLAAAEALMDPQRLTLFSKFEGLVAVNEENGHHPNAHGHQGSHKP